MNFFNNNRSSHFEQFITVIEMMKKVSNNEIDKIDDKVVKT